MGWTGSFNVLRTDKLCFKAKFLTFINILPSDWQTVTDSRIFPGCDKLNCSDWMKDCYNETVFCFLYLFHVFSPWSFYESMTAGHE